MFNLGIFGQKNSQQDDDQNPNVQVTQVVPVASQPVTATGDNSTAPTLQVVSPPAVDSVIPPTSASTFILPSVPAPAPLVVPTPPPAPIPAPASPPPPAFIPAPEVVPETVEVQVPEAVESTPSENNEIEVLPPLNQVQSEEPALTVDELTEQLNSEPIHDIQPMGVEGVYQEDVEDKAEQVDRIDEASDYSSEQSEPDTEGTFSDNTKSSVQEILDREIAVKKTAVERLTNELMVANRQLATSRNELEAKKIDIKNEESEIERIEGRIKELEEELEASKKKEEEVMSQL